MKRKKSEKRSVISEFFRVKEGIALVMCAALILMCSAVVSGFSGATVQNILSEKTLDVNSDAGPDKETVIVLDAGHGGIDCGAVGVTGVLEKDINLDIALTLRDMLVFEGYTVVMTREDDSMYYDESVPLSKKTQDTRRRVEITKQYENCIFVSIHMNKYPSERYSGLQVYYSPKVDGSEALAKNVQQTVKDRLQNENNRQIKKGGPSIYVLDKAVVPAILIECGFLSNISESEKLSDKNYRQDLAGVISDAIDSYMSQNIEIY